MPQVYMVRAISGTRDGQDWPAPGGRMTVSDDEAAQLIAQGVASAAEPNLESAVMTTGAVETAAVDTQPAKKSAAKRA